MVPDQPATSICMILNFSFVFKGLPSSLKIRVPEPYLEICVNKKKNGPRSACSYNMYDFNLFFRVKVYQAVLKLGCQNQIWI